MKNKIDIIYEELQKPLDRSVILRREHDKLEYIAGYVAIAQANKIFGFDSWGYSITKYPELIQKDGALGYLCAVKVWVKLNGELVEKEDVGYKDVTLTKKEKKPMLEVAYKGCVTDALKRALRSFGDQFGNSLYDREDKLEKISDTLSTEEEKGMSEYMQTLLDCKTEEEVNEALDNIAQIAIQDKWTEKKLNHMKMLSKRVKDGIVVKNSRKEKREQEKKA